MKLTRTSRLLIGTLAAMTLTLSACSSSDDSKSSSSSNNSSSTANKAASNSNKGGGSVGDKEFCQKAVAAGIELSKSLGQSGDAHRAAAAKTWADLAKIAPGSVRSDVQEIADVFANGGKDPQAAVEAYKEPMKRYTAWGQTHCQGVKPPAQP